MIDAFQPLAVFQRFRVLQAGLFADVAPVACLVTAQELLGALACFAKRVDRALRDAYSSQLKHAGLQRIILSNKRRFVRLSSAKPPSGRLLLRPSAARP